MSAVDLFKQYVIKDSYTGKYRYIDVDDIYNRSYDQIIGNAKIYKEKELKLTPLYYKLYPGTDYNYFYQINNDILSTLYRSTYKNSINSNYCNIVVNRKFGGGLFTLSSFKREHIVKDMVGLSFRPREHVDLTKCVYIINTKVHQYLTDFKNNSRIIQSLFELLTFYKEIGIQIYTLDFKPEDLFYEPFDRMSTFDLNEKIDLFEEFIQELEI